MAQVHEQKAKDAIALLEKAIKDAASDGLYGEVIVKVSLQNGRIGHYERVTRETYK